MSQDSKAKLQQLLASGELKLAPATLPQLELWQSSRVPPTALANHICAFLKVRGALDPAQVEGALRRVVERQEALRTSFLPGKEGRPVQMIKARGETPFTHRKVPAAQAKPEGLEELMAEIFAQRFDFTSGPLFSVSMLELSPNEAYIPLSIHHSVADGWTLGVFVQDLVSAYLMEMRKLPGVLPPVQMTYAQWSAAETAAWPETELASRATWWQETLAGTKRLWEPTAPSDKPLTRWITQIPAELAAGVRETSRKMGATLYSTLLADFQLALHKWTGGGNEFVLGTPVANRNKAAVKETMGYFAGNVPIRADVDAKQPARERSAAVQRASMDAFANAMPFNELAARIPSGREAGRHPVYDVRFALQNHPIPEIALSTLSAKLHMRSTGTARFDLACELTEEGSAMECVWLYRPEKFTAQEIEELNQLYQKLLAETCRAL